jgi:hypothetical protein
MKPPPVAYQPVVVGDQPGHWTLPSIEEPPDDWSTALTTFTRDNCDASVAWSAFKYVLTPANDLVLDGHDTAIALTVIMSTDIITAMATALLMILFMTSPSSSS